MTTMALPKDRSLQKFSRSMKKKFLTSKSQRVEIFDGTKVRRLMGDEERFKAFLEAEFDRMDTDLSGTLSLAEMKPALLRIGKLMGLPPPGTAEETDNLVDGLFASLVSVDLSSTIDRGNFVKTVSDILLEASHLLEDDPVSALVEDGSSLRAFIDNADELEAEIERVFNSVDKDGSGRISRAELRPALQILGLSAGAFAQQDGTEHVESLLDDILARYSREGEDELSKDEFMTLVLDALKGLMFELEANPLFLPQNVTVLNGVYIRKLISDEEFFNTVADGMFDVWDASHRGELSFNDVMAGFKKLGLSYGMPPADTEEAKQIYTTLFLAADVDASGYVDKQEFKELLRALFTGIQMQLEEKPVMVDSSCLDRTLSLSEVYDGRRVMQILRDEEGGGRQRVREALITNFRQLDKDENGQLSRSELLSTLMKVSAMIDLPPLTKADELERRADEVFQAIFSPDLKTEISEEEFVDLMMRVLEGIGETLRVDPVSLMLADGQHVQQLLSDPSAFNHLIDETFSCLDTDGSGALTASELKPVVETMKEHVQLPPWGANKSLDAIVADLIMRYGHGKVHLTREGFSSLVSDLLKDLSSSLASNPIYIQQNVQVLNGSRLREILRDPRQFKKVRDLAFSKWDLKSRGKLSRKDVELGLKHTGMWWGLPPYRAKDARQVYLSLFEAADVDHSGYIDREEFDSFLFSYFQRVAKTLEENPVVVEASIIT